MLQEFKLAPGFLTNETDRGAKGRWKGGDHVRFREGLPEKLGGWVDYPLVGAIAVTYVSDVVVGTVSPGVAGQILGVVRSAHDWVALDNIKIMAIGTHLKLYLMIDAILYDITPIRASGNLAGPFTTTASSPIVSVNHAGHGLSLYDFATFSGATAVGGITIAGNYQVIEIVGVNDYKIQHTSNAGSGATGGGTVAYLYEIPVGFSGTETFGGYGLGPYGGGGYGMPIVVDDQDAVEIRIWSLDNFGEDLVASPRAGPIYYWDRTTGPSSRAVVVATAPSQNNRVFVDHQARIVVSAGSHDGVNRDQLLVRWSDEEDLTVWTPALNNSAGAFRLNSGSKVVTAEKTRRENVIFTDEGPYVMQLEGGELIYRFTPLGESSGVVGPEATAEINGVVFYGTNQAIFAYDGVLKELECDVRTSVFGNMNQFRAAHVVLTINRLYSELWILYPSGVSNENDRYAIFNYKDNTWVTGTIVRTCMQDFSAFFRKPYGFASDGKLRVHETGSNDVTYGTATVVALPSYIESYDGELGDGDQVQHVSELVPDFDVLTGAGTITLSAKQYPNSTAVVKGPYAVTDMTKRLNVRARGRQISLRFDQTGINSTWRMGSWRLATQPDGVR